MYLIVKYRLFPCFYSLWKSRPHWTLDWVSLRPGRAQHEEEEREAEVEVVAEAELQKEEGELQGEAEGSKQGDGALELQQEEA